MLCKLPDPPAAAVGEQAQLEPRRQQRFDPGGHLGRRLFVAVATEGAVDVQQQRVEPQAAKPVDPKIEDGFHAEFRDQQADAGPPQPRRAATTSSNGE